MWVSIVFPVAMQAGERVDSATCGGDADTEAYRFNYKQLIVPGALITAGALGALSPWLHKASSSVRDPMSSLRGECYIHADDYIQYLPVAAHLGLGLTGMHARSLFRDRFMAAITSSLVMAAIVNVTKYSVREKRPDTSTCNSFPSGHSATAFMGAELVRLEYSAGVAVGAYSVAVLTGFLRIYNDRHWLHDVLAGAGIGILSARIGYWMLPLYRRWFHWNRSPTAAPMLVAIPSYLPATRSFGLTAVVSF